MNNKLKNIFLGACIIFALFLAVNDTISSSHFNRNTLSNSNRPVLAIISSGANLNQVNYDMNTTIRSYNAMTGSTDIQDEDGAGTRLFAALYNDRFSLNATNDVLLIKAYASRDSINQEDIVTAIEFAIENNANVININIPLEDTESMRNVLAKAREHNILIVMPVNEENQTFLKDNHIITVSALNNEIDSNIKVDDTNTIVCVDNRCNVNKREDLNAIFASEYILRNAITNPNNLIISTQFGVSSD